MGQHSGYLQTRWSAAAAAAAAHDMPRWRMLACAACAVMHIALLRHLAQYLCALTYDRSKLSPAGAPSCRSPLKQKMSLFAQGTELVGKVKSADGKLRTAELLEVCRSILPIVGEWWGGWDVGAGQAPAAAGDPRAVLHGPPPQPPTAAAGQPPT